MCPQAGLPVLPFFLNQLLGTFSPSEPFAMVPLGSGVPRNSPSHRVPTHQDPTAAGQQLCPYLQHTLLGPGRGVQTRPPHLTLIPSLFTPGNRFCTHSPLWFLVTFNLVQYRSL